MCSPISSIFPERLRRSRRPRQHRPAPWSHQRARHHKVNRDRHVLPTHPCARSHAQFLHQHPSVAWQNTYVKVACCALFHNISPAWRPPPAFYFATLSFIFSRSLRSALLARSAFRILLEVATSRGYSPPPFAMFVATRRPFIVYAWPTFAIIWFSHLVFILWFRLTPALKRASIESPK